MTYLYIAIAFWAGALFWHYVGIRLMGRMFGTGFLRQDVLGNISTSSLLSLQKDVVTEVERRRSLLREVPE